MVPAVRSLLGSCVAQASWLTRLFRVTEASDWWRAHVALVIARASGLLAQTPLIHRFRQLA
jgi:hypothetical protein